VISWTVQASIARPEKYLYCTLTNPVDPHERETFYGVLSTLIRTWKQLGHVLEPDILFAPKLQCAGLRTSQIHSHLGVCADGVLVILDAGLVRTYTANDIQVIVTARKDLDSI
jgi:hypothetical protein